MLRPRSLALAALLCVFVVPAGAKPEARSDDDSLRVSFNKRGRSPCALALDMRSSCEPGTQEANSTVTPTKCTCNNIYFNLWSSCALLRGDGVLPTYDEWGAACKNASSVVTDGYAGRLDPDIPTWALISVPDDNKFHLENVLTMLGDNTANGTSHCTSHWTTTQMAAPFISSVATLILVGIIILLSRSKSMKKKRWPRDIRRMVMPHISRVHKVRKADRSETWSIDQTSEATGEFVVIERDDAGSFRVKSPDSFSQTDEESSPLPPPKAEWHLPGKALWKKPMQLPSRFPIPWKDRAIAVQSVLPTRRFHIDSMDHSTLSGLSGGSTEGGHRTSTNKFSMEVLPGGSSRAHETIEEGDEDEDTSLISPGARSDNHVFLISNRDGFTVGSRTSTSQSHRVHVQPPTPTISSHNSPVLVKKPISKPKPPSQIPPPPTQPAPSPPILPPRIPPQLQKPHNENHPQPIATTSRLVDAHVPPIPQPPLPIPPPRPSGPLRIDPHTQTRRQLSVEEDDPLHHRSGPPTRKPLGARQNLTSPSSKESLRHENAFSNLQYSTQFHQRQLSDSAARRSPLHWRDETYPDGASPPYVYRELSIEEELSNPTSHLPGIAGPSSQLPRSPAPIPHRRGHSADDATSVQLSVSHPSLHSHTRNLSSESVILSRSDPVNLFSGAVRATGYPGLQAATESSNSLYSDGSYPRQPPNVAHPHHWS